MSKTLIVQYTCIWLLSWIVVFLFFKVLPKYEGHISEEQQQFLEKYEKHIAVCSWLPLINTMLAFALTAVVSMMYLKTLVHELRIRIGDWLIEVAGRIVQDRENMRGKELDSIATITTDRDLFQKRQWVSNGKSTIRILKKIKTTNESSTTYKVEVWK